MQSAPEGSIETRGPPVLTRSKERERGTDMGKFQANARYVAAAATIVVALSSAAIATASPGPTIHEPEGSLNGATGLTGYEIVTEPDVPVASQASASAKANCPAGKKVLSGGYTSFLPALHSFSSGPSEGISWGVMMRNSSNVDGRFTVYAICVTAAE